MSESVVVLHWVQFILLGGWYLALLFQMEKQTRLLERIAERLERERTERKQA